MGRRLSSASSTAPSRRPPPAFGATTRAALPYHVGGRKSRYNIAPTQTVVTVTEDGGRQIEEMKWGLVPAWAKDSRFPRG
jgi:putative SOS response-associated peptidase YedK